MSKRDQTLMTSDLRTGYADVNGLKLYYEIRGTGDPVLLLHGGLGSTAMFDAVAPALARNRQTIAVDLRAHGHTADNDRPFDYGAMAEDLAGLLKHLSLSRADVVGYSLGGGAALRLAIQHPAAVRKLVVLSTPFRRNAWFPEVQAGQAQLNAATAEALKPSPLYASYASVAPNPGNWTSLVVKTGQLITRDYDWSSEIAAIQASVMLVFGDADAIRPEHIVEFYQRLGGGLRDAGWDRSGMSRARLAILPNATHYDILSSPLFTPTVEQFLAAK